MQESTVAVVEKPRIRLEFLDGIRGIAALYVLLFHIHLKTNLSNLPEWFQTLQSPISYGHFSVCVFIVLSGYCLMLPVARSSSGALSGNLTTFFQRRARRILPPYFAAFFFSLVWSIVYQGAKHKAGQENTLAVEVSVGNIVSHLLLLHNLIPQYWEATNGALWSVATEWQIYFIFALLLIPVWRKYGEFVLLLFAIAIGIGPHYLLPEGAILSAFDMACSWFIILFSLGMLGANLCFSNPKRDWVRRFPWGTSLILLIALLAGLILIYKPVNNPWEPSLLRHFTWITDVIAGVATLCFIMFCALPIISKGNSAESSENLAKNGAHEFIIKALESRMARALGDFSYSLYLIHLTILEFLLFVVYRLPVSPLLRACSMWVGGVALSIGIAMIFSRIFERPFMSSTQAPKNKTVGK